jgi:hypothetical protein
VDVQAAAYPELRDLHTLVNVLKKLYRDTFLLLAEQQHERLIGERKVAQRHA